MRPLSASIRLWWNLKAQGIGVVLGNPGWHDTVVSKALVEAEIFHQAEGRGVAFVPMVSLESQPVLNGHPLGLAHGYHWVSREVAHSATSPFFSGLMSFCSVSSPADCDSYCKASKGKLKMNMKKYCRKDYGECGGGGTSLGWLVGDLCHRVPGVREISYPRIPCLFPIVLTRGIQTGRGYRGWDS